MGKAFGFHRAGDTIGAIIGPLLGVAAIGLLHDRLADPSLPFRVVFPIAAELLPAETRGLGYGLLGSVNGVGDLFSSVIVGLLWAHVSITAGLLYSAALSVAGAVLILRVR